VPHHAKQGLLRREVMHRDEKLNGLTNVVRNPKKIERLEGKKAQPRFFP
jgi:hypothetical protein